MWVAYRARRVVGADGHQPARAVRQGEGDRRGGGEHGAARRRGGERRGADALGLDVRRDRPAERPEADDRRLGRRHAAALRRGGTAAGLFATVFVVYWCFGTQLSVNASTAADFWGTRNAGINYGMLYTAYGVAGVDRPEDRLVGLRRVRTATSAAFDVAAVLAAIALACELIARRPSPPGAAGGLGRDR